MNSFIFFHDHFGKYFSSERSNKLHMDASRVLRASYPLKGKPKPTRLAFGWAIIRPGTSSLKLNLDISGLACDPRPESMSFLEELKSWDDTPRMFLLFGKAPIPISNLFLTLDLRAVRICSPKGVETFDFTKTPEETGSNFHKRLVNMDKKMLRDHVIPKPETIVGYKLHQLVEGLTEGDAPLFLDRGKSLLIRTEKKITETGTAVEIPSGNSIIGFELRACVSKKVKGKHRYFPVSNYQIRHGWLRTKGEQFGFEPLTVTCSCEMKKITDGGSRSFQIDHTDFAGILKVFDEQKFKKAMETGVGSTARAFGYGMLIL